MPGLLPNRICITNVVPKQKRNLDQIIIQTQLTVSHDAKADRPLPTQPSHSSDMRRFLKADNALLCSGRAAARASPWLHNIENPLTPVKLWAIAATGAFSSSLPDRAFRTDSQITIKSLPTTISPLKCFAAGARQVSSLMLSMAGVRCDSTSVLTPASCAMRPTSSTGV